MAKKNQLNEQPFTCDNLGFQTNTQKGMSHGLGKAKGSVFKKPLVVSIDGKTLWLEHVIDKKNHSETFWLMWYGSDGSPTIPMSGVISADQVKEMASRLADFIKL